MNYKVALFAHFHTKKELFCMVCSPYKTRDPTNTVKDNPQLSNLKEPGTSKLAWRYFEHNKVEKDELQVCKNLHRTQEQK